MKVFHLRHARFLIGVLLTGLMTVAALPLSDLSHLTAAAGKEIPPYEILMTADTIARFDGIYDMPKWSPPGSNEPTTHPVAVFSILAFQSSSKPSKYGDNNAEEFRKAALEQDHEGGTRNTFMVAMDEMPPCQYSNALRDIAALKAGDTVRLCWMHIYIDNNGSRYPERPVTLLRTAKVPDGVRIPPPYAPPSPDRMPRPLMMTE